VLVPGTQLKVVPGPFRADVNLATSELTLFLGEMYAGRFPFALGTEPPQPGSYKVQDKQANRTYYAADGRTIPANDPANPYGGAWIDLGHEASIHGSAIASAAPAAALGCISLSPQDARDVFGILSVGSDVVIRR
jgi:lipoprotein-anchoring transpeptidase ErfK/SrfK